jgi:hypothetical protein
MMLLATPTMQDLAWVTIMSVLIVTVVWYLASRAFRSHGRVTSSRNPHISSCCEEMFISPSAAYTANATDAIVKGSSLMRLHALASPLECKMLLEAGTSAASEEFEGQSRPSAKYGQTVIPARVRMPVDRILESLELKLCDLVLRRALARLAIDAPQLCLRQLGASNESTRRRILGNPELIFSDGEPAINVYRVGGDFKPHQDKMSMTILVSLSDNACGSFTGGGTAFWSEADSGPERPAHAQDLTQGRPPSFVVQASAGSALVFTGSVTHGAMPVLSGERAIFVASFGPQDCVSKAPSSSAARIIAALLLVQWSTIRHRRDLSVWFSS